MAGLIGLVAYSLTTAFFANAPYVDIVRGHAFAPWLLLLLSPLFPWRRWWAVPVAALFLWQIVVSTYPGMLVAFGYCGAAWALTWQLSRRPALRHFLLPVAAAGVIAVLLALPKYLPMLGLHLMDGREVPDLSVLPVETLGTFLLPSYDGIPGVGSLESFFIPAAALLLAALMRFRDVTVRAALVAGAVALVLGVPELPLRGLVDALPGIGLSRFRLNDFRPFVLIALVVGAMSGFSWLVRHGTTGFRPGALVRRVAVVLAVPVAAAAFLVFGRFREGSWVGVTLVLGLTVAAVLVVLATAGRKQLGRGGAALSAAVLVALTVASGMAYGSTVQSRWNADTLALQNELWGATSAQLIDQRVAPAAATQRPARMVTPPGASPKELISAGFNSSYYTGILGIGGYLNAQGSPSFVTARGVLENPATAEDARALLGAPGIAISRGAGPAGMPAAADVRHCVETGECGSVISTPVSYEPGHMVFDLEAQWDSPVILNEAYYTGWSALLVNDYGRSKAVEPQFGPGGMMTVEVPEGSWRLTVTYRTPLADPALALALLGVLVLAVFPVWALWRHRRPGAGDAPASRRDPLPAA
jgi:hypothetical protein